MSASARGSSPLARGLRHGRACLVVEGRIIPARAGFTDGDRRVRARRRDHPRSRGVYCPPGTAGSGATGSSPLARGLRPSRPEHERGEGIIPARAGFTSGAALRLARSVDHPRSRGVYWPGRFRGDRRRGSSPLARGLRPARVPGRGSPGIIPARAGFTGRDRPRGRVGQDHPRSRGVYRRSRSTPRTGRGSSPLARGLPRHQYRLDGRPGIIPARAGFTCCRLAGPTTGTDHPRSRGVYR